MVPQRLHIEQCNFAKKSGMRRVRQWEARPGWSLCRRTRSHRHKRSCQSKRDGSDCLARIVVDESQQEHTSVIYRQHHPFKRNERETDHALQELDGPHCTHCARIAHNQQRMPRTLPPPDHTRQGHTEFPGDTNASHNFKLLSHPCRAAHIEQLVE